jgi:septum site-determining protein MinD
MVLQSTTAGGPVILDQQNHAALAYLDVIHRFLGQDRPQRFLEAPKKGFFQRMFGGGSSSQPVAAVG